jgi:hypothetical protein
MHRIKFVMIKNKIEAILLFSNFVIDRLIVG